MIATVFTPYAIWSLWEFANSTGFVFIKGSLLDYVITNSHILQKPPFNLRKLEETWKEKAKARKEICKQNVKF